MYKAPRQVSSKCLDIMPKGVAHEDLIYPVAEQEIRGGQLHIVLGVSAQDPKEIVLHIQHQVMGVKHW